MDIQAVLAAVAAKSEGWETLLIEEWPCLTGTNAHYIKLLEILSGQGVNPNATTGQDLLEPLINGVAVGKSVTAYGTGTAYSLTNAAAAIDLGTTDPAIVLDEAGTYLILGQAHLARAGATVVAETATIKVRRTNNTAADVSVLPVIDLPASTTLTDTLGIFAIPPFIYTTANDDDALALFGQVSATLSAGTINATAIGTSLVAIRLF
jgi:hypothetical protein